MRNLKRVLALALALVMMLGMMITASAASYTDQAAITEDYAEAVDVLTGLGVFKGQSATSAVFAPKAELTREEAATLIYRVITGDVDDKQTSNYDYAAFADMQAGKWSNGYVTYAANGGYIKGYNGNFMPTDKVTGIQVMAIMLRAAGYGQNGEYEGAAWKDNILTDALELGITGDIAVSTLDAPATRELVAQLIFNAMTSVKMVAYSPLLAGYIPLTFDIRDTNKLGVKATKTLGEKVFGLYCVKGVITDTTALKGTTEFDGETVLKNTAADWTTVGYAARAWAVNGKALSLVVTGKDLSVTTNGTKLSTADKTGLTDDNNKNDNYVADLDAGVIYVLNGEVSNAVAVNAANGIGAKIALVNNDKDAEIDAVVCTAYTAAQVTRVQEKSTSGEITVAYYLLDNGVKVEPKNLKGVDALELGDYITYVVVDGDYYVTLAAAAQGEFESITRTKLNGTNVKTYNIDGAGYIGSQMTNVDYDYVDEKANINNEIVYVVDEYGYLIFAKEYKDPYAYLYVLGNEHNMSLTGLAETEVAYADGKVEIVDVKEKTIADGLAGEIYTYTVKNGAYVIEVATDGKLTDVDYNTDEIAMTGTEGTVGLSKYTTVVDLRDVIDGKADEGTVYVGWNEIPSVVDGEIVYTVNDYGKMDLAFLIAGKDPNKLAASFVVFDTNFNVVDKVSLGGGNYTYTYELIEGVIVKGELKTNYVLSATQKAEIEKYGVGVYTFDNDGELTKYVSFAEDSVKWEPENYGTVIYKNTDITADYKSIILNITDGEIDDWELLVEEGNYFAYIDEKNEVMYIVGDTNVRADILAPAGAAGTGATEDGWVNEYWAKDEFVTAYAEIKVTPTYSITINNYVEGLTYAVASDGADASDLTKVVDGTYYLHVKAAEGYTKGDIYVGDDVDELDYDAAADRYTIVVDGKDVVVEIHGAAPANKYTITFDTDGGSSVTAITQDYGTAVTAPAAPTKAGFDFAGWDKTIPATMPAENMTIKALWTPATVTLTVEYYDEAGNMISGQWINKTDCVRDTAITVLVDKAATYEVNGVDKGYVLDGEIKLDMKANTTVVVTYVSTVPVTVNAAAATSYTVTADVDKVSTSGGTVKLTFKNSAAFSKTGTLEMAYTLNGVADTATATIGAVDEPAVFQITVAATDEPIEIVVTGNLGWATANP